MPDSSTAQNSADRAQDALLIGMMDSAPAGAILTDNQLRVIHVSPTANHLLGTVSPPPSNLTTLLTSSRLVRPTAICQALESAVDGGPTSSFHIAESQSGEDRCILVRGAKMGTPAPRWVWWLEDVTDSTRLQRLELLAEIGRARGPHISTTTLANQLVESLLNLLGVDIAAIMLGDATSLKMAAVRGVFLSDDFKLYPQDRPYLRKAIESKLPVNGDGSEWGSGHEMSGTHYIVPLVTGDEVIGTLHMTVIDDGMYGQSSRAQLLDRVFLEALSAYAGAAIANTLLFEEVREERKRLRTVVEHIPQGIVLYDARGEVMLTNESLRRITERDWSNVNTDSRGYRLRTMDGELLRRGDWPLFRPQRDPRPIIDSEVILELQGRRKMLAVTVVPIPRTTPDAIPSFVGTMRDITAEHTVQAERESFLQVLSHELRSPLTPLSGFLQMVRKQAESGEELDSGLLLRAERQVQRLGRLLDRVLDLNRLERGIDLDCETQDLGELVTLTAELWDADPRGVRVIADVPPDQILANVDSDRIEQVLTNLVDNAIKHSTSDGTVRIKLRRKATAAILTVSDEGTGIAEDQLAMIFERFYSADGRRAGLGIGLYITRQIVRAHGGEVTVRSAVGNGSSFEVRLPAVSH